MVCDESLVGNIRPSFSVLSLTPRDSNQATVSLASKTWLGESKARSPRGNRVVNSRGSKQA